MRVARRCASAPAQYAAESRVMMRFMLPTFLSCPAFCSQRFLRHISSYGACSASALERYTGHFCPRKELRLPPSATPFACVRSSVVRCSACYATLTSPCVQCLLPARACVAWQRSVYVYRAAMAGIEPDASRHLWDYGVQLAAHRCAIEKAQI